MKSFVEEYVRSRLQSFLASFGAGSPNRSISWCEEDAMGSRVGANVVVGSEGGSHQVVSAIHFAEKHLGRLVLRSPHPVTDGEARNLEELAAQLGPVLRTGHPASLELDSKIQALHERYADRFSWTGIYRLKGDHLWLTCFRGAPTPHPIIPEAKGICGAAVRDNQTLNIADVTADPRYLACDLSTRSELVVPIQDPTGRAIGEIDIDSKIPGLFPKPIVEDVETLCRELAPLVTELLS